MKKNHLKSTFVFIVLGIITSCSKNEDGITPGSTEFEKVYVAGSNGASSLIWNNGNTTILDIGINGGADAKSIFIKDSDVYVAGSFANNSGGVYSTVAVYWKNGVKTFLTYNYYGSAESIFVEGNDVYVAGYENNQAKIWKNGVATILTDAGGHGAAKSVFVQGSDVYVAGFQYENQNSLVGIAKLWKNGIATNLTDGNFDAQAISVFVNGADVYVVGYEKYEDFTIAKLWKNGISISLSNNSYAVASAVFVSGSDVYVVGSERYESEWYGFTAKIWKNGEATSLTDGTTNAIATSVYVKGSDVYVTGYEGFLSENPIAKLWKNSIDTHMPCSNNSLANSVFVK